MSTIASPRSRCSSASRLRICACTETSSAETGSSATISSRAERERGRDADALALPARELVRAAGRRAGAEARRGRAARATRRVALGRRADRVGVERLADGPARPSSAGRASCTGPGTRAGPAAGTRASCCRLARSTSAPSNTIRPAVGVGQTEDAAAERALARARTRRRPRATSPASTSRSTPSTAWTTARRHEAAADGEVLDEAARPRAAGDGVRASASERTRLRRRQPSTADVVRLARPRSGVAGARRRSASRRARPGSGARTGSRAAGRRGPAPGPRSPAASRAPAPRSAARRAAPACTGAAARRRSPRPARPRTSWPAYITADPVAQLRDDAQVVGDEQDRRAARVAQVAQQGQDLRLDGDVERGGRLVGDEQRRVVGERRGDHDALAHAAAKPVRRIVVARSGAGMPTSAEQRRGRVRCAPRP